MKILGNRVLIEHKAKRKRSAIHVLGNDKNADVFDMTFTVLALGDEVEEGKLKKGDQVILGTHTQPNLAKEIKKTNDESIYNVIVQYEDIEAVLEPEDLK